MTFHLKKVRKQGRTRIKFDLEKLKDPQIAETYKAMVGGKLALLILLDVDESNMDDWIDMFNVAVKETANETLGKSRHKNSLESQPTSVRATNAVN